MNERVLRRFIVYLAIATFVMFSAWMAADWFASQEPGDYHVRKGDIRLSEGNYDEALENFNRALEERPDHRGALMGRALVFIQTEQYREAIAELDYLIERLETSLDRDDMTGVGVLAAAYANRGIVHDRLGQYEKALDDYVESLRIDEESVSGPNVIQKILYMSDRASTVRDRARYIYEQLQLPESERLMRVPELDARQRMHKP